MPEKTTRQATGLRTGLEKLYPSRKPKLIFPSSKLTNSCILQSTVSIGCVFMEYLSPNCKGDFSAYISIPFDKELHIKERNCPQRENKFFPLRNVPKLQLGKNIFKKTVAADTLGKIDKCFRQQPSLPCKSYFSQTKIIILQLYIFY